MSPDRYVEGYADGICAALREDVNLCDEHLSMIHERCKKKTRD
jgi:hypothetical protein